MNHNQEQQPKQTAQQFEQQAQQAKQGEEKAQVATKNAQMSNLNKPTAVPGSELGLDKLKFEVAKEIGVPNYDQIDRGSLTARQNGIIGGKMTKGVAQTLKSDI
ncbi:MAG TPA: alpha/beta-type small acid-soluble spore protein [Desulfosporosinus sp.]|nr:alpha/beta-type small acid-soluble spore protein [Desulfosporosinus sp.]